MTKSIKSEYERSNALSYLVEAKELIKTFPALPNLIINLALSLEIDKRKIEVLFRLITEAKELIEKFPDL